MKGCSGENGRRTNEEVFKTARCRWNNLLVRLSPLLDAGGFNRLIARNRIKKTPVGAV